MTSARRPRPLLPLLSVALLAAAFSRCTADRGGGGDVGPGRCEIDLTPHLATSGVGAVAKVAGPSDLLAGEAATGRVGDVLLRNERVQVVIEQAGRTIGPQPYGGNIVDADVVRPGEAARDRFGELGSLFQFGRTVMVDRVEVLRDGSAGGAAVVAASGRDGVLDFINLKGLLRQFLPGLTVPDTERDLGLRVTKYYLLAPGSDVVRVIDAYCNDGAEPVAFAAGDLVDSGGQVESFTGRTGFSSGGSNPGAALGGFTSNVGEPFMAWVGRDVTYGLVPATDTNAALVVAGVTASVQGNASILDWTNLTGPTPKGAVSVEPGQSAALVRDFVVGAGPEAVFGAWYALRGVETQPVAGVVRDAAGAGVEGSRVVARSGNKTAGVFRAGADGRFSGRLPAGEYEFSADDDVTRSAAVAARAGQGDIALALPASGEISVKVTSTDGDPMPGKATLVCQGACAHPRSGATAALYRDVGGDKLPTVNGDEVFDYLYLGPDGVGRRRVPAGAYTVYLSRGTEYALERREVAVTAGEAVAVEAGLAHVVDTRGWTSGDFHVHAINSPDSPIGNVERLVGFMAEGVDVIVSTDHDYVTDFRGPLATIPGGDRFIRPVTGVELTTFDYGHFNAFPLVADPASRNGGAVDWAGDRGPGMTHGDIFEALESYPGEQVVQINHARGGAFSALELDTRTLWTRGDPSLFRIRRVEPDAATGDTRLFDARFTAMEIQNGFGTGWITLLNDWMSLLSRGVNRTGTAVSDTHKRHGDSGYPRTYVRTGTDELAALDDGAFARAVNEHRAFGTNGPFVLLTARAGAGEAGVGDTLVTGGGAVTVRVEIRSPEWVEADQVQLFVNAAGTECAADLSPPRKLPEAAATLAPAATLGDSNGGRMRVAVAEHTFTPAKDAWVAAVVTGSKDMFPVVGKGGTTPLAFTNALLLDVDGKGWTPPVDLAAERARVGKVPQKGAPLSVPVTEDELRRVLARECHDEE